MSSNSTLFRDFPVALLEMRTQVFGQSHWCKILSDRDSDPSWVLRHSDRQRSLVAMIKPMHGKRDLLFSWYARFSSATCEELNFWVHAENYSRAGLSRGSTAQEVQASWQDGRDRTNTDCSWKKHTIFHPNYMLLLSSLGFCPRKLRMIRGSLSITSRIPAAWPISGAGSWILKPRVMAFVWLGCKHGLICRLRTQLSRGYNSNRWVGLEKDVFHFLIRFSLEVSSEMAKVSQRVMLWKAPKT